jgi:hypothetical protein
MWWLIPIGGFGIWFARSLYLQNRVKTEYIELAKRIKSQEVIFDLGVATIEDMFILAALVSDVSDINKLKEYQNQFSKKQLHESALLLKRKQSDLEKTVWPLENPF